MAQMVGVSGGKWSARAGHRNELPLLLLPLLPRDVLRRRRHQSSSHTPNSPPDDDDGGGDCDGQLPSPLLLLLLLPVHHHHRTQRPVAVDPDSVGLHSHRSCNTAGVVVVTESAFVFHGLPSPTVVVLRNVGPSLSYRNWGPLCCPFLFLLH